MKQDKTEQELVVLIREHAEMTLGEQKPASFWITVTSVGCDEGNWRIAHTSDAVGLQDALTAAENNLGQIFSLKQ